MLYKYCFLCYFIYMKSAPGEVAVIGTGITGLVAGYALHAVSPETEITFIDAGPEPFSEAALDHRGATLGQSRDARQFTGTEGLSFQNPVHTRLIGEQASPKGPGWQTIPEEELTEREQAWRAELVSRYHADISTDHNPYDAMYTTLNYGGMAAWQLLTSLNPALAQYRTYDRGTFVTFASQAELEADFDTETAANPQQSEFPVRTAELSELHAKPETALAGVTEQALLVPGQAWRIRSVWHQLYGELVRSPSIHFEWDQPVTEHAALPDADSYVWAAGSGYSLPEFYEQNSRVQGIGGWWLTLPNPGFKVPFKFSAPQPTGYMNFTPVREALHISGGFGWIGERSHDEAVGLLEPAKQQFLGHVGDLLGKSRAELADYDLGCCIRPTTPTGLPDIGEVVLGGKRHIMLSGAGKAGATQASILGLHAAAEIAGHDKTDMLINRHGQGTGKTLVQRALAQARAGLEKPIDDISVKTC